MPQWSFRPRDEAKANMPDNRRTEPEVAIRKRKHVDENESAMNIVVRLGTR